MRTEFTRILLIFLMAWLPSSFAHAGAMGCLGMGQPHDAACVMQHGQMHQGKAGQAGHAPSGCHDCALCYSCSATAPRAFTFGGSATGLRMVFVAQQFTSFFPEQPERPPRA
jgi:hypothetical protein